MFAHVSSPRATAAPESAPCVRRPPVQGSLQPTGTKERVGHADTSQKARPVIRRGMLAWAGGAGGPDFFIALAQHPEWGNGHTVFGEVFPEDMAVIDKLMTR